MSQGAETQTEAQWSSYDLVVPTQGAVVQTQVAVVLSPGRRHSLPPHAPETSRFIRRDMNIFARLLPT